MLERKYGVEETDHILFETGKISGKEFYHHYIDPVANLSEFVSKTQRILREKNMGILRMEETENGRVVLTVDEDLECSGMPVIDVNTCVFDEGFITALFESFTKQSWVAKETDCWSNGARTCRFLVTTQP